MVIQTNRQTLAPLVLEERQSLAVEQICSEPTKAALNASLMGTGKTLMGVEVVKRLGSKTVLIIG